MKESTEYLMQRFELTELCDSNLKDEDEYGNEFYVDTNTQAMFTAFVAGFRDARKHNDDWKDKT